MRYTAAPESRHRSLSPLPTLRHANLIAWTATLLGLAYGIWAWGTVLLFGMAPEQDLFWELVKGFAMMPVYLPAFLGLYLIAQGFTERDNWTAVALALYALVIGHLLWTGTQCYVGGLADPTAFGIALPVCTILTALLSWRIHSAWAGEHVRVRVED